MVVEKGEKVHIISRRQFEKDLKRHFAGTVEAASEQTIRVKGYVFVLEPSFNQFQKRKELRTRIFSLVDANSIINILPPDADIEKLQYQIVSPGNHLVVTDGKFSLDINEFGSKY